MLRIVLYPKLLLKRPTFDPTQQIEGLTERSSKWREVRQKHLFLFPFCFVCGGNRKLNVHHIVSFDRWPEGELAPNNLMTLCTEKGLKGNDHFEIGHCGISWKHDNPNPILTTRQFQLMDLRLRLAAISHDTPYDPKFKPAKPSSISSSLKRLESEIVKLADFLNIKTENIK